jgi:homogentisate 1,2-dioxygenase
MNRFVQHRNVMSEFMGMIYGKYDAKEGFMAGGASLHNMMTAHGPDEATFEKASAAELAPQYFDGGMAFMFESALPLEVARSAINCPERETTYQHCWQSLQKHFSASSTGDAPMHPHV